MSEYRQIDLLSTRQWPPGGRGLFRMCDNVRMGCIVLLIALLVDNKTEEIYIWLRYETKGRL